MLGKPVVSKNQRAGRIKQSDIEVQIHTITSGKYYGQVGNFRDGAVRWTIKQAESNWRSCGCLQVVSIHKFRVYKAMSRPWVNKSLEQDFIKMILTRIKREVRETKSEWESERANALSRIRLVAAQGSSTWPSVCAESWGLLFIFPRVSRRQLPEYQQLLKHRGPWERP